MPQQDSDDLKNELTRLLAKSRQLKDRSGTLDEEIQRLTRIIAGTAEPAGEVRPEDRAPETAQRRVLPLRDQPGQPIADEVERLSAELRRARNRSGRR